MPSLVSAVEAAYGLRVTGPAVRTGGFTAENHRVVSDRGDILVKVLPAAEDGVGVAEAVARIWSAAGVLVALGLPTPPPLPTLAGEQSLVCDDASVVVLRWIDGEVRRGPELTEAHLAAVGRALATLHCAAVADGIPAAPVPYRDDVDVAGLRAELFRVRHDVVARGETWRPLVRYVDFKVERLSKIERAPALRRTSLVHGDFHNENLLFLGERLVGILDLEWFGLGVPADDVVLFLQLACFNPDYSDPAFQRAGTVLTGYREVRPLGADELHEGFDAFWRGSRPAHGSSVPRSTVTRSPSRSCGATRPGCRP